MKLNLSHFLYLFLFVAFAAGCGDQEARKSTDGADLDAISEYEAAVAAAEQQSVDSGIEDNPEGE